MRKILALAPVMCLLAALFGCGSKNEIGNLYETSVAQTSEPAKWAATQPALNSVEDSASYLMGYIYGGNMRHVRETGQLPFLNELDMRKVETGFAMALNADSADLSTLYGIMLGLELRGSMQKMNREISLDWDATLVYKGYYQGLNATVPQALSTSMAEEQLNRLLRPYFLPDYPAIED